MLAGLLMGDCVRVTSTNDVKKRRIRLFIVAVSDDGRLKLVDELVDHDLTGRIPHDEESALGPFDSSSDYADLPH